MLAVAERSHVCLVQQHSLTSQDARLHRVLGHAGVRGTTQW